MLLSRVLAGLPGQGVAAAMRHLGRPGDDRAGGHLGPGRSFERGFDRGLAGRWWGIGLDPLLERGQVGDVLDVPALAGRVPAGAQGLGFVLFGKRCVKVDAQGGIVGEWEGGRRGVARGLCQAQAACRAADLVPGRVASGGDVATGYGIDAVLGGGLVGRQRSGRDRGACEDGVGIRGAEGLCLELALQIRQDVSTM